MEKKDLRAFVRAKKRAMTPAQVEAASARLAQQLFRHPAYQAARSLYGYLSYNQEVRTAAILRRAQQDGKRVAVPKVFGDEMKFLWLDDLSAVAPGAYNIPEPVADGPEADDETALVLRLWRGLLRQISRRPPEARDAGAVLRVPDVFPSGHGRV